MTVGITMSELLSGDLRRWIISVFATLSICIICYIRKSLTITGCLVAFPVGLAAIAGGFRCTSVLLTFFISSTIATKLAGGKKSVIYQDHAEETKKGRKPSQVVANGSVGTVLGFIHIAILGIWQDARSNAHDGDEMICGQWHRMLFLAYVGSYAFGAADTFASEIGMLSKSQPRLITTWRIVPSGTNGGVTLLGFAVSALGALLVGLSGSFSFSIENGLCFDWTVALTGLVVGVVGTVIDSILGATLQYSGAKVMSKDDKKHTVILNTPGKDVESVGGLDILSNSTVNFISSLCSAILAPFFCCCLLFY